MFLFGYSFGHRATSIPSTPASIYLIDLVWWHFFHKLLAAFMSLVSASHFLRPPIATRRVRGIDSMLIYLYIYLSIRAVYINCIYIFIKVGLEAKSLTHSGVNIIGMVKDSTTWFAILYLFISF